MRADLMALLEDGELRSPAVGVWRGAPREGDVISPGSAVGALEVLGVLHRLVAPQNASGVVVSARAPTARVAVGYRDRLVQLDPLSAAAAARADGGAKTAGEAHGLALRSPTSGRFYRRAAPGKPPFVEVGDLIDAGRTVCLLEVMKTFNRVAYGGDGLPGRARVLAVVPPDESDLDAGDVILEIEPA